MTGDVSRGGRVWLGACAALALGCLIGLWPASSTIDWQPQLADRQPWRWWTAAFVHWSPMHLLANLAGLAVVAMFGRVARVPAVLTLAWLAAWPFTHLALLLRPEIAHFGGLSGLLHAGVAVVATFAAARLGGRAQWIGRAVLAGLLLKVLLETPWGAALRPAFGTGLQIAPLAHAAGAVAGVLITLIALARGPAMASAPAVPDE